MALYNTLGDCCFILTNFSADPKPKSFNVLESVQASTEEAPQAVTTIPIGTSSTFSSCWAKKYPTALKDPAVEGAAFSHLPFTLSRGFTLVFCLTVKKRILSFFEFTIASNPPSMKLPSNPPLRGICIFDCPEHTHTSPINTSLIVTVDDPLIVMLCGPPAVGVVNCSFHLPFVDVVVWEVSPHELSTCIFVPAESIPQKLILFCCCSIMPSLKNEETLV